MNRVEIRIKEYGLPSDVEILARHVLADGTCLDLTPEQWGELHAWLDLGERQGASGAEIRRKIDDNAP